MKDFIAVVGATGAVGRKMLDELAHLSKCNLPIRAFASARSAGIELLFGDRKVIVEEFRAETLKNAYVLMSAGGDFSRQYSKQLVEQNCIVIDNSSAWRMDDNTPLVVPEVNMNSVEKEMSRGIIANPNCSTIQMVVSLKPLLDRYGLNSVNVSTYQSVSGAGQKGIEDLQLQLLNPNVAAKCLPRKIVHDVIPAIDRILPEGHCFEEVKMVKETRKILSLPNLKVFATTVRVPTYYGHGEAVTVELASPATSVDEVFDLLSKSPGLKVVRGQDYAELPTPVSIGETADVYLSRIRFPVDETRSNLVQYWNVAHNLYKGAASNAVQILENLIQGEYE